MRARSIVVPALVAVLAVVLTACSSTPSSPISDPSAVLSGVPAAASRAGTVHFVEVTSSKGFRSTLTGQLSASSTGDAQEHLVQGDSELDLERVSGLLYLRGSAAVLESALGFSAKQAAPYLGKWVSISPGDFVFGSLSQTLDLGAEIRAFVPAGQNVQTGATRKFRDTTVVPISGAPPKSTAGNAGGDLTLFVATSGDHLPAGATLVLRKGSNSQSRIVAFTHWGQPINLTAPPGATAYRVIAGQ